MKSLADLPETLLKRIAHFFGHYKDLENNKWVKIESWEGLEAAQQEILGAITRYQSVPQKPHF